MKKRRTRHVYVQLVRRCLQTMTVLLIIGIAFVSLYAHYRAAHALEDLESLSGLQGIVLRSVDGAVSSMESPQAFLDGFKGTLWSMRIFGFDVTDPLAAVEMAAAAKTIYLPLFVSCTFWVLITLLFGRVYCSWICPGYLLFELAGKLRKLLRIAEVPPAEVSFSSRTKYIVLPLGLAMAFAFSMPLFALVYPPAVLSRIAHAWVFGTALAGMLVLIGAIIAFEVFVSPRWWCRAICPGGALFAIIGWPRPVRVKLNESRCTHCDECGPVCEPGLDPVRESSSLECDNCGQCVRHCPENALSYSLGLPKGRSQRIRNESMAGKAPLVLAIACIGSVALPAEAHHILGLPHYSYKENYPQVPTLEYPAQTGPYDVLLTSYPGIPLPGETANIAIYIKNRQTGAPFEQPVEVRVLQTYTFGKSRDVFPRAQCLPFDNLHKLSVNFPEEGEYIVELSLEVEGKIETIPFAMIAGNPTATASMLVATGIGLTVFFVVVRAIRIKRARRSLQEISRQMPS
jgi:ferredoxin-type protein NapH